jgi:hypothetical protein
MPTVTVQNGAVTEEDEEAVEVVEPSSSLVA